MVFIKPHLDHNVISPPHFMNVVWIISSICKNYIFPYSWVAVMHAESQQYAYKDVVLILWNNFDAETSQIMSSPEQFQAELCSDFHRLRNFPNCCPFSVNVIPSFWVEWCSVSEGWIWRLLCCRNLLTRCIHGLKCHDSKCQSGGDYGRVCAQN